METSLATVADAPALVALHAESFGDNAWNFVQIVECLSLLTTYAWVVCEADKVLGFILCQIVLGEAEILTFCVSRAHRRKGIGLLLLDKILDTARNQNIHRLFLEVAVDNIGAIEMYRKKGFQINGTRAGYYTHGGKPVDALMLVFDIS